MLQEVGFSVEAVAFQREYHKGRLPSCTVSTLGSISHGRYFARGIAILRSVRRMRAHIRRADLVYASGIDMAFLALLAGIALRRPIVVEVGDVREIQVSRGILGHLLRVAERILVNSCGLLIATAPDFVSEYYRKRLRVSTRSLIIENKLEATSLHKLPTISILKGRALYDRPMRIGYFGLLRCAWSWHVLSALAKQRPNDIEIVVAGLVLNPMNLLEQAKGVPNVQYLGQYTSPRDLPKLYNQVDLVWACYPPMTIDDWNFRWARTNRFYEACFFKRPLVTREGSNDAKHVLRHDIGLSLSATSAKDLVSAFAAVSATDLERWISNMERLPNSIYQYTSETLELRDALVKLARKN